MVLARTGAVAGALALMLLGCGPGEDPREAPGDDRGSESRSNPVARSAGGDAAAEAMDRLQKLYEDAVEAGDDVSAEVFRWTQEDLERFGDWEYRVEQVGRQPTALAQQMNAWGAERWEIYWIEPEADGYRLFLKRPARSYLRQVPLSTLFRLLPAGGSP